MSFENACFDFLQLKKLFNYAVVIHVSVPENSALTSMIEETNLKLLLNLCFQSAVLFYSHLFSSLSEVTLWQFYWEL